MTLEYFIATIIIAPILMLVMIIIIRGIYAMFNGLK